MFAFGRRTPLAAVLRGVNVEIAFTLVAVILAQTFVAYIKSARAGFQAVPKTLLEAAAVAGAGGWHRLLLHRAPGL